MNYLFLKTIQYSAKQIIKLWILCMPLVFLLKILRLEDWNIIFALAVALIGLMSWTASINLQIVPALMRRYSRSVNHFWLMLIGLQITNLFFNVACFFAFILILNINLQLEILSHLLPIDYFWLFLIGLTFSINRLGDIKVSIANLIFTKSAIILLMQFLGL